MLTPKPTPSPKLAVIKNIKLCIYCVSGLDLLVSVYRDLVELPVDQAKYKSWASKSLPENLRPAAHILSDFDRGRERKRE